VRILRRSLFICLLPAVLVTGCGDPFFGALDPLMVTDSLSLAAPSDAFPNTPSALDVTSAGGFIRGGRFPERLEDATIGWDLAVRVRDGGIVFLLSGAAGFGGRAGISEPLAGQTFEGLTQVPSGIRYETETAVPAQVGSVYVVRSREFSTGFGGCVQYSKLEPTEMNPAEGTVRVRLSTNERCYDNRLVPAGG
jgi:hypothetical protein